APPVDHRVPGEVPNLIGRRFSVEVPTQNRRHRRGRVASATDGVVDEQHLPKAVVRRLWLWLKVCAVYVDARRACVEQLKAQTEWYWGPGCRVDRDGVLIAYGQAHELDRLEWPSAQDRRPKQNRRIGPERVRIREREATELPPPIVRR